VGLPVRVLRGETASLGQTFAKWQHSRLRMQETISHPKATATPQTENGDDGNKFTEDKSSKVLKADYSCVMYTLRLF